VGQHKHTHRNFVEQVSHCIATRSENEQLSPSQLLDYLSNWLIFHILGDDQSMGRQIRAVKSGVSPKDAYSQDKPSSDPRTDILLGALRHLYADLKNRNALLIEAQAELRQLNATLELRVTERTQDLEEANLRLTEERRRAIETEKMASLGRLVAGFAHEINTPVGIAVGALSQELEVISGFDRLLQQSEVTEADVRARLNVLRESSAMALSNIQRAASLVQSFKRTAVDQSSDIERVFAVADVIADVMHNIQPIYKRSSIRVNVDCPESIRLLGVPGAWVQIFTNLFINAHDHAFLEGSKAGIISISAKQLGSDVEILFGDDGVGIDKDELPKIFEPFYTTRRSKGGSGLGLYIVYNLVTQTMGGSIKCQSSAGVGTEFRIQLSLTRASG
jgi:signal transduction histidine kinase